VARDFRQGHLHQGLASGSQLKEGDS